MKKNYFKAILALFAALALSVVTFFISANSWADYYQSTNADYAHKKAIEISEDFFNRYATLKDINQIAADILRQYSVINKVGGKPRTSIEHLIEKSAELKAESIAVQIVLMQSEKNIAIGKKAIAEYKKILKPMIEDGLNVAIKELQPK